MRERYEIRRKIGQGGLGTVYHAYDTQLRRDVAIKRLFAPVDASGQPQREAAAEKLMREATALSRVNHPNIVSVFDVGVDADGGYVVMELLDGETLTEVIAKGPLTLEDFHQVVIQTLEALIAAEAQEMLHRDLKPSNLMITWLPSRRFLLKVLDFGLAKVSAQPSLQTIDQHETILGSVHYMAPEQFERRELTFSTDLYSMGCIYYYCLAGKDAFTGRSVANVMHAHLHAEVVPLHEARPDLPPQICDWVMWLMRKDMSERPQTAQAALDCFPLVQQTSGSVRVDPTQVRAIPPAAAVSKSSETEATTPVLVGPSRVASGSVARVPGGTRLPAPSTSGATLTRTPTAPKPAANPALLGAGAAGALLSVGAVVLFAWSPWKQPPAAAAPTGYQVVNDERTPVPTSPIPAPAPAPAAPVPLAAFETSMLDDRFGIGLPPSVGDDPEDSLDIPWKEPAYLIPASEGGHALALDAQKFTIATLPRTYLLENDRLDLSFDCQVDGNSGPLRFLLVKDRLDRARGYLVEIGTGLEISLHEFLSKDARGLSLENAVRLGDFSPASATPGLGLNSLRRLHLSIARPSASQGTLEVTAELIDRRRFTAYFKDEDSLAVDFSTLALQLLGSEGKLVLDNARLVLTSRRPFQILIEDDFDSGKNPSIEDDKDVPHDRPWQGTLTLLKPSRNGGSPLVNGSNALASPPSHVMLTACRGVTLVTRELIEASFTCKPEGSIESLRTVLADNLAKARGYLLEIGPEARLAIYKYDGQDAQTCALDKAAKLLDSPAPAGTPPLALANLERVLFSVARLGPEQARIQATAFFAGDQSVSIAVSDVDKAPLSYSKFGIKPEGNGGQFLVDDVRLRSSIIPPETK